MGLKELRKDVRASLQGIFSDVRQEDLEVKPIDEKRILARQNHQLVDKSSDFNPDLIWTEERTVLGYKKASGYTPESNIKENPTQLAYWCGDCNGWVNGKPTIQDYKNASRGFTSSGTKSFCKICDQVVG